MKLTMLGTGDGLAIKCYNTCFTLSENNEHFLVDCGGGNGILKQLKDSNIEINQIKNVFISHTHTDHIIGAVWMLRMFGRLYIKKNFKEKINIYGNDEVINALITMRDIFIPGKLLEAVTQNVNFIEVKDHHTVKILNRNVTFFDINAAKVKQFGFYISENNEKKFTFIGDENCNQFTEKYVKNSEWLFSDALMAGEKAELYNPMEKHHHSSVRYATELAERLNVKKLILSHVCDNELEMRKERFVEDAKKYFSGEVYVPYDLEELEL
ncbi:MAG: MBL fold metallo-hydrolase [Clostridia bacterium]|nr:MBL fold metallo-hydrolase [Clostridia bacterium]